MRACEREAVEVISRVRVVAFSDKKNALGRPNRVSPHPNPLPKGEGTRN